MKLRGYGHCSDHVGETIEVAAVTKPKPPPDQLENLLRRLLANVAAPVPVPAPVQVVPTVPIQVAAITKPKPPPDQWEDLVRRLLANVVAPVPVPAPVQVVPTVPIRMAAVTKPKPPPDQLEDLLRRLLANVAAPVPVQLRFGWCRWYQYGWRQSPNRSLLWISWRICGEKLLQCLLAEIQSRQPAAVTKPKPSCGSVGGSARTVTSEQDCPVPVPASVQGGRRCSVWWRGHTRTRGVQIVPLRTTVIGTTDSADTSQKGSEWRRMFFMRKVGSYCNPLPHSG